MNTAHRAYLLPRAIYLLQSVCLDTTLNSGPEWYLPNKSTSDPIHWRWGIIASDVCHGLSPSTLGEDLCRLGSGRVFSGRPRRLQPVWRDRTHKARVLATVRAFGNPARRPAFISAFPTAGHVVGRWRRDEAVWRPTGFHSRRGIVRIICRSLSSSVPASFLEFSFLLPSIPPLQVYILCC